MAQKKLQMKSIQPNIMKVFFFSGLIFLGITAKAQIGIGVRTADPTAQLEVSSTSKGLLLPRLTKAQRDALSTTAAKGLMIGCTDWGPRGERQVFSLVATNSVWTNMIGTNTYTRAERNALSPSINLQIYCSDCGTGESQVYNGSIWTNLAGGTAQ